MYSTESKIADLLLDLKENHGAISLKAEFEDEGADLGDVLKLKHLSVGVKLNLSIKIGGCSAITDMVYAKKIGADEIIAPMIESPYSASKFIDSAKKIYDNSTKLFVNIETKYALNFINDILQLDFTGITLGRSDLIASLEGFCNDVNSDKIFNIAKEVSLLAKQYKKEFTLGGAISRYSIPFLSNLPFITRFETRKIIFDANKALNSHCKDGIQKALDFELLWLKYNNINTKRINVIKSRF